MDTELQGARYQPRSDAERTIGILSAVSIALLVIAVITSYFMFRESAENDQRVTHTLTVQRGASEIWADLLQAESAQRGFLITSDESVLLFYTPSIEHFWKELANLRTLTLDNPEQTARLDRIKQLATERIKYLDQNTERIRQHDFPGTIGNIRAGVGKRLMDDIRELIADFKAEEDALLSKRVKAAEHARDLSLTIIEVTILLSVIAAGLAGNLVRQRFVTFAESQVALERRVRERTAELEESKRRSEAEAARATREQERVELLLRDLNHRVGNNLATISALLGLQINRTPPGNARTAIESARDRVGAIGIAQRRLRLGDDLQSVKLDEFFESVLGDVFAAMPRSERFTIRRDFESLLIGSRDAVTLSVVMNELITNAAKHAFPNGRSGTITASLRIVDGVPTMSVSDDGVGMTPDETKESTGLGATVIERMSQQYGGGVTREANRPTGTVVRITMPRLRSQPIANNKTMGA